MDNLNILAIFSIFNINPIQTKNISFPFLISKEHLGKFSKGVDRGVGYDLDVFKSYSFSL